MKFLEIVTLAGPNIWSRHPVLEAWVDLEDLKDSPSSSIPGFTDRLMAWIPSLIEHRCSVGERGGFLKRLVDGTWPGHILEHVCLELQTLAGTSVGFGKARETAVEGIYKVVVRYKHARVGTAALYLAREVVLAAAHDRPLDLEAGLTELRALVDKYCLGPSTQAIVDAAEARNIPTRRMNDGSFVLLGQGRRARRIWTAETDATGAVAGAIAQDKELTKSLLRQVGVPVPEGRAAATPDEAWSIAESIGVPVVVKPRDANHGRGVFTGLRTSAQVERAFHLAAKEGSGVMVETFAPGAEHRLLVVGDKLVAATRGDAAFVIGDGVHTVWQLVETQLNSDPRRGIDETAPLCQIEIDPILLLQLEQQGHTPDTIPGAGEQVLIQRNDNLSVDVTDDVHARIAEQAVVAAKVVGLDIAGLDLVCEDVSRPLEDQGGRFIEVNAGPGLLMHLKPSVGRPRPVGEAIVELLFAPGEDGRVPVVAVSGTNGKTTVCWMLEHVVRGAPELAGVPHTRALRPGDHAPRSAPVVGLATNLGVRIHGRWLHHDDGAGLAGHRQVLLNPAVDVAILEASSRGILREGLGFDKCDVAVVLGIGEGDHLGQSDIHTAEQLYTVDRSAVDVTLPTGFKVLKADDPIVAEMAALGKGATIFFARDADHPLIAAHRASGGRAVYVRHGHVALGDGTWETPLVALEDLAAGAIPFQLDNVLATAAAAWALKVPLDTVRERLVSWRGDLDAAPARFNVLTLQPEPGATGADARQGWVILDDAHNPTAIAALGEALERFPATRRVACVSAGPSRRDVDVRQLAERVAQVFDEVVLYADPRNERAPRALTALLREGLEAGRQADGRATQVAEIADPSYARRHALEQAGPGVVVVLQAEDTNAEPAVRELRAAFFSGAANKAPHAPSETTPASPRWRGGQVT
jgi:cyanophycin synthetase